MMQLAFHMLFELQLVVHVDYELLCMIIHAVQFFGWWCGLIKEGMV